MSKCFFLVTLLCAFLSVSDVAQAEELGAVYNTSIVVHATGPGTIFFVAKDQSGRKYNFFTTRSDRADKLIYEAYTLQNKPNKFDVIFYKNRHLNHGGTIYTHAFRLIYGGHKYDLEQ